MALLDGTGAMDLVVLCSGTRGTTLPNTLGSIIVYPGLDAAPFFDFNDGKKVFTKDLVGRYRLKPSETRVESALVSQMGEAPYGPLFPHSDKLGRPAMHHSALECDEALSDFAFNFNLRRYKLGLGPAKFTALTLGKLKKPPTTGYAPLQIAFSTTNSIFFAEVALSMTVAVSFSPSRDIGSSELGQVTITSLAAAQWDPTWDGLEVSVIAVGLAGEPDVMLGKARHRTEQSSVV